MHCPISGDDLHQIVSMGRQPIFMGTTTSNKEADQFNEMNWGATKNGVIHLMSRIPLDVLYSQSHNSGLIGGTWKKHHIHFSEFISTYSPKNICEIGGGHGILSQNYAKLKDFSSWDIYEPNAKKSPDSRVTIHSEFFHENTRLDKKDCILHSHLFEHLYDHSAVLKKIHHSLTDKGVMIFSLPNMEQMIKNGYVNALNFEHVTYLPEDLIEFLLKKNGFVIDRKDYFLEDHSIFYACKKTSNPQIAEYKNTKHIDDIISFFATEKTKVDDLNSLLSLHYKQSNVFLFGAHIFSQFYLTNGLDNSLIKAVLDNDPEKQQQRLYGTNLKVASPTIVANIEDAVVLVRAGAYQDEIVAQLNAINPCVEILL